MLLLFIQRHSKNWIGTIVEGQGSTPSIQHEWWKRGLFNHLDRKLSVCIECEFGRSRDNHASTHQGGAISAGAVDVRADAPPFLRCTRFRLVCPVVLGIIALILTEESIMADVLTGAMTVEGAAARGEETMARGRTKKRLESAAKAPDESGATTDNRADYWRMADALRGSMDAAEYKHVVLGLIFLKYISDAFEEIHTRFMRSKGYRVKL